MNCDNKKHIYPTLESEYAKRSSKFPTVQVLLYYKSFSFLLVYCLVN